MGPPPALDVAQLAIEAFFPQVFLHGKTGCGNRLTSFHSNHPETLPPSLFRHTMSRCQAAARPLVHQLRQQCVIRPFSTSVAAAARKKVWLHESPADRKPPTSDDPLDHDPITVLPEFEGQVLQAGKTPVGSRRKRAAVRTTGDIPFEQLPYQTFQEARKILAADREEKLAQIKKELDKISWLEQKDPKDVHGGQKMKDIKLAGLRRYVERLKILADANDPLVKKRFEDGLGGCLFSYFFCSFSMRIHMLVY